MRPARLLFFPAFFSTLTRAQNLWCGKPYEAGAPQVLIPPESHFPIPAKSSKPLLNFACNPVLRPYVSGEDTEGGIIIDADISYDVGEPYSGKTGVAGTIVIKVEVDGKVLNVGTTEAGTKGKILSFPLNSLGSPRSTPFTITCSASTLGKTYKSTTPLYYLSANPSGGTTTKTDLRTGGLMIKPKGKTSYEPFFPVGYYCSTGVFTNQTAVDAIAAAGYNVLHPVPPFASDADRAQAFEYMENAGLYLVYDMRHDYTNLTSIHSQVSQFASSPVILSWYTSDEPDGTQDAVNASSTASSLIHSLDPYHPVSLALNCFDYYWKEYSAGTDIILEDVYPIGINTTYSFRGTVCNSTYGDCGCDDCVDQDGIRDVGARLDAFHERAYLEGKERSVSFWGVPQAFGEQLYWPRLPTGIEHIAMSASSILHGAKGLTSWILPNSGDIYVSSAQFAKLVTLLSPTILGPETTYEYSIASSLGVEAGLWTTGRKEVLMVVGVQNTTETYSISIHTGTSRFTTTHSKWTKIFESGSGATLDLSKGSVEVTLGAFGTVVYTRES